MHIRRRRCCQSRQSRSTRAHLSGAGWTCHRFSRSRYRLWSLTRAARTAANRRRPRRASFTVAAVTSFVSSCSARRLRRGRWPLRRRADGLPAASKATRSLMGHSHCDVRRSRRPRRAHAARSRAGLRRCRRRQAREESRRRAQVPSHRIGRNQVRAAEWHCS